MFSRQFKNFKDYCVVILQPKEDPLVTTKRLLNHLVLSVNPRASAEIHYCELFNQLDRRHLVRSVSKENSLISNSETNISLEDY